MCQNALNILSSCHNADRIIFGFERAMLLLTFTLRTLLIHIQNIELLDLIPIYIYNQLRVCVAIVNTRKGIKKNTKRDRFLYV